MSVPHYVFDSPSTDAINEPLVNDFPDRYSAQSIGSAVSADSTYQARASPMPSLTGEVSPIAPAFTKEGYHTPQDLAQRPVNIPTRTSSTHHAQQSQSQLIPRSSPQIPEEHHGRVSPETTVESRYRPGERSSGDSIFSQETSATSIHTLPALQTKGPDNGDVDELEPMLSDDPRSFDLLLPQQGSQEIGIYALEKRAEQMLSAAHLRIIFENPRLLLKFTGFLNSHRPKSLPVLIYYLDALKAIRAINYANAIAEALEPMAGHTFSTEVPPPTQSTMLQEKAAQAFDVLVREDLPAYIAHTWISVVSISIQRRITGTLAPHLREASEGLAEVFCLSDPSRTDNPIVFASEEFVRMTQYGMNHTIGRNCRFLQGPKTSPHSVRRLAEACQAGREITEVFVNYRRDGSPFMNLLMIAPLMDSRGNVRYFIGAQVDVSGLIKDCAELEGLAQLVERESELEETDANETNKKDEFQDLTEMFNGAELETVRKCGGRMHKEYTDDSDTESIRQGRRRVVLKDHSQDILDDRARSSFVQSERSHSMAKERLSSN
nr:phototropin-2 [Quercus suber]